MFAKFLLSGISSNGLAPITASASLSFSGLHTFLISFTSCCPSASNVNMYSALCLNASSIPVLSAAPKPLFIICDTIIILLGYFFCDFLAFSRVLSDDPSFTNTT